MTATPSNSGIFIVPDNVVSDSMKFVNFLIAKYKADDAIEAFEKNKENDINLFNILLGAVRRSQLRIYYYPPHHPGQGL